MLPSNPLLQLTPARARRTMERVRDRIWSEPVPLGVSWTGASREHVSWKAASGRKLRRIRQPFFWGGMFDQAWFKVEIPAEVRGGAWFMEWKEQGESTAYIGGVPYAGLDVAHHTCRIPARCREIWVEAFCMETGIWEGSARRGVTAEGCRFERAAARQRNDRAWKVFHDLDVLIRLLASEHAREPGLRTPFEATYNYNSPLEDVSPLYRRLSRHLDEACDAFDTGDLEAADIRLKKAYRDLAGSCESIRCRLSGHAHIDLVWLWPERAAEAKAVHTFATANRLMDDYPEFRFGYSQPASYRAVEKRCPSMMKMVRERIRQGTWEPVGASEVESDTQLACGEALARSLLIGQAYFKTLQGKPSPVMWLPDVFGYTGCLPQILKQTGVEYFFTTKLTWGSITPFPYSSFLWKGPDGSEILAHVAQGMGYNQSVTPEEVRSGARNYRQSDIHDEFLMPSGYGDGGGGPTPEMCERARRMADLAGTPATAWGRIDDFFSGLEKVRTRLPAYRGELYLQYHRGVHTTHGNLKDAFRAAERGLQCWEAAHCLAGKGAIDEQAWQRMVFAQFHDYIPGSSVREVYEEALPELEHLRRESVTRASNLVKGRSRSSCVFNPLPLPRIEPVVGVLRRIPPLCVMPVRELERVEAPAVHAASDRIGNGRVEARFDRKGRIRQLTVDGREIASAGPLADLVIYPDQPHAFDAWDMDRATLSLGAAVESPASATFESDKHEARVLFSRELTDQSRAVIRYEVRAGEPVLRITYHIEWKDPHTLLKATFPTRYNGEYTRYGAPFGSTLRSQQPGQPYNEAQWEVPGSRYAMVTDDGEREGLFVVTEAKYGWSCREGCLGLSLLRSAKLPVRSPEGTEPGGTGKTEYSDLGHHTIRLAIGRYDTSAPREELPAALADTCFTPVFPTIGKTMTCGFQGLENGDSLIPCWAKPENPGSWVLLLHETLGRRGKAKLLLEDGWQARAVDLSGHPVKGILRGHTISYTPYQVVSMEMKRDDKP